MQFNLYVTTSEVIVLDKNLRLGEELNGNILDESSIVTPVFLIEAENISVYNYMYVPDFNRYYFITDISVVRTNLWRVSCSVDVLMSYKTYIRALACIIDKQQNQYKSNRFLNDGSWISDQRVGIEIVPIKYKGSDNPPFSASGNTCLITIGPGGSIDG